MSAVPPPAPQLITAPDREVFGLVGARIFGEEAARALSERGAFRVALAGGSSPLSMYRALADIPYRDDIDWARIHVFFGDERCVAEGNAQRNDKAAMDALLDHVSISKANIHRVDPMLADAADRYDHEIRSHFAASKEAPRFDLILLGIGTDGHTASLFPGSPALAERSRAVVKVTGAPKPPPDRITITLPLINFARCVLVLAPGPEKRTLVGEVMFGGAKYPIAYVRPTQGRLYFLVDPPDAEADGSQPDDLSFA